MLADVNSSGLGRLSSDSSEIKERLQPLGFGREASKDIMETASIYEIVDQCLGLQQTRFERHRVELTVSLQPYLLYLPYLLCRETQIGQIITTLLNNAFDAIAQSESIEREVILTAESYENTISIDVIDSGPDIDEKFRAHLMELFFTTKETGLGMGTGLSLSRAIAQDHGGSLTLLDDTKQTCFRLTVPVVMEHRQAAQITTGAAYETR
jgi:C4-dicarboxylate-specific signal transduction histidine kinase